VVRGSEEGSLRADQDADQGRERRAREGEPIGYRGRPLEGGNTRRASATVSELTLAARRTALPEGETPEVGRVERQSSVTACRGRRWAGRLGNVRRGAGVERRTGLRQGKSSGGVNPRSVTGTKQGREGLGKKKALRG
jgi:hypothetical protein